MSSTIAFNRPSPPKLRLPAIVLLIVSAFLLWGAPALGAENLENSSSRYRLGQGIPIAESRLRLGGYSSIEFEDAENKDGKIVFEDFSIFIYGDIGEKTSVFSEFENSKFLEIEEDGKTTTKENWQIERLYIDHLYKEKLNIRVGKFLTPIGSWNELHADPLTWTVSRPLVTYAAFPEFITGIQLFGDLTRGEQDLTYSLTIQNNESINERTGFHKTHLFYSARLKWLASPSLEIGIPIAYYTELYLNDKIYLTGLEFTYRHKDLKVSSELTYSRIDLKDNGWTREYGYYLQGTHPVLRDNIFLVLRHEYFRARSSAGKYKALSIGAVYKPVAQVVFKVEYKKASGSIDFADPDSDNIDNADIWLASFSILL